MLKALEKALFAAESDTRRRKSAPALREIEAKLTKSILAQSLALQIIRNSKKPTSDLLAELVGIEAQVGEFVGQVLEKAGGDPGQVDLRGLLAGALSLIPMKPFGGRRPSAKKLLRRIALAALDRALPEQPSPLAVKPPQGIQAARLIGPSEEAARSRKEPPKVKPKKKTKPKIRAKAQKYSAGKRGSGCR